jgi:hypothetical protein
MRVNLLEKMYEMICETTTLYGAQICTTGDEVGVGVNSGKNTGEILQKSAKNLYKCGQAGS